MLPQPSEQSLRDDIRFLGSILGDTIREQEGQEVFDLIEKIRKLSVAFRRDADAASGKALDKTFKKLKPRSKRSV